MTAATFELSSTKLLSILLESLIDIALCFSASERESTIEGLIAFTASKTGNRLTLTSPFFAKLSIHALKCDCATHSI